MEPLAVRPIPEAAAAAFVPDAPPAEDVAPDAPAARPPALSAPASRAAVRLWGFLLAAVLGLAFGAWAYYTRELWLPSVMSVVRPAPAPYVGLNTTDAGGQLQIRWDRNSPSVRGARNGILTIGDGPVPEAIELDPIHLQTGVFTYARKGARIDVAMTLNEPDGQKVREATTYLGTAPESKPTLDDSALRKERDDLARSLELERARSRKLEKQLQKTHRKR